MWASLIPMAISGVASYFGGKSANKAQAATLDAYLAQSAALSRLTPPNLVNLIEPYQKMVWLGQLTPEEAMAQVVQQSEMAGIQVPEELKNAQYEALRKLQEIADEGGLTVEDRAAIENIRGQVGAMERGARERIIQSAQERGRAGGGLELAQRLIAQQGAAQRGSQMGFDVAKLARERALQATMQAGQLGGQIRGQEFSEQAQIAAAKDAVAKFNAQLQQQAEMANVAARNQAAQQSQAAQYDIQRFNAQQKAAEQAARLAANQQEWANQFGQTQAVAGRGTTAANYMADLAAQQQSAANAAKGAFATQAGDVLSEYLKRYGTGTSGTGMTGFPSTGSDYYGTFDPGYGYGGA